MMLLNNLNISLFYMNITFLDNFYLKKFHQVTKIVNNYRNTLSNEIKFKKIMLLIIFELFYKCYKMELKMTFT